MNLNTQDWDSTTYYNKRYPGILAMEESGNEHLTPYNDSKGLITIGIGFNLSVSTVRSAVLAKMGITNSSLIQELNSYLGDKHEVTDTTIQNALNRLVKKYAADATFTFANSTQVKELFNGPNLNDGLAQTYETQVNTWVQTNGLPAIPQSAERLALLSLAYNVGPAIYLQPS